MAQTTRTFRIFVSSTFSDLKEERNALQKYVFPRLRDLCTQHGCRFQAIDLRWGVREEAGLDQQTMKICLDEVSRSQRASPRPNFIVLLGDRYGWRPLPAEIPRREFEHIRRNTSDRNNRQLLDTWYKRDDNALFKRKVDSEPEPVYSLQPRSDRFIDFQVWEPEVERPLRAILLGGIEGLELSEDERRRYEASATEQEIAAGALRIRDASEHVFGFFRKINGMREDRSATDFIDLNENGTLDSRANARLGELKTLLETRLGGNIHAYDASWTGDGASTEHIGSLPEDLEACRELMRDPGAPRTVCVDVWKRLATVIEDEIKRLESIEPLEKEIADHAAFAEDRARLFVGRRSMLDTIAGYLANANPHALAVWGESGSGKSALMAKAISNCKSSGANREIVYRFIGATPASSDARSLLESVCRQITRIYGGDEATIPTDYKELVKEFGERLKLATAQKPLVVVLDALDQLSDADHARNLIWLPAELPANVRVVVSTLPVECKTALERKLPAANLEKLEPMPKEEADELLEAWLSEAGRTLQAAQREEVLRKFALSASNVSDSNTPKRDEHGMPLYLKLAFEEARRWKSYAPAVDLKPDIPGIIRQLFARLSSDASHGET
ncbi:MAG: AAA family ATPase, partial [Blastocatellia bacterium]